MSILARIPLWGWYVFSALYCYALYNPVYGLYEFLLSGWVAWWVKGAALCLLAGIGYLFWVEGRRSLNAVGIAIFWGVIGFILYGIYTAGNGAGFGFIQWWGQLVAAAFLTIALQWGATYRLMTQRVPVNTPAPEEHQHDGAVPADHRS